MMYWGTSTTNRSIFSNCILYPRWSKEEWYFRRMVRRL